MAATLTSRISICGRAGTPAGAVSTDVDVDPGFLERYELGEVLGRGGMGMVLAARRRDTGERLAVKFMLKAAEATVAERFQRECELLSRVHHPSVVRVHEVGAMQGHPYLVCEFHSLRNTERHASPSATAGPGAPLGGPFWRRQAKAVFRRAVPARAGGEPTPGAEITVPDPASPPRARR